MSFTINIINDSTGNTVKSYQISDANVIALNDSLPGGQAILDWIENAIIGKISSCKKRMIKHWISIYMAEGTDIPGNENAFIEAIAARSDYLDRAARDALESVE